MRKYAWLFLSFGLVLSLHGCAEDENTGGTGNTGGGGATATVTGTLNEATEDGSLGPAIGGATVSVFGESISTMTDPDGSWMMDVPVGDVLIVVDPGATTWGVLDLYTVPSQGLSGVELEVITDALVGQVEALLDETANTAQGIVAVEFDGIGETAIGGETASVNVSRDSDSFDFVFNASDEPEVGSMLLAGGDTQLVMVGVPASDSVVVSATNSSDVDCPSEAATYPTIANTVTEVVVTCP